MLLCLYCDADSAAPAKIIGGGPTEIEQVPYQGSLRLRVNIGRGKYMLVHVCGATLISQRLTVTAAHCVAINGSQPLRYQFPFYCMVLLGTNSRDVNTGNLYDVQMIIGHDGYEHSTMENDIALLFLNSYIPWGLPKIRAIALAIEPPEVDTVCSISGWGKLNRGKLLMNGTPEVLQLALIPIIDRENCLNAYNYFPMSELCAGDEIGGTDSCMGDSGGPLVCDQMLAGIVSWGIGCGEKGHPGVYTNIAHLHNWIVMKNASLNYSDYDDMEYAYVPRTASSLKLGLHLLLIPVCAVLAVQNMTELLYFYRAAGRIALD